MAAPKPTKRKFQPGRTAAIAARQKATEAQTAPGTEYKAARAARKAGGGGGGGGDYFGPSKRKQEAKRKEKERTAKRMGMIASMRERLKAGRSKMPTMGSR